MKFDKFHIIIAHLELVSFRIEGNLSPLQREVF